MAEFTYNETRTKEDENLFLSKVLGFTGIAVLVTAVFGYFIANIFHSLFYDSTLGDMSETGYIVFAITLIIALITSMILSAVGNAMAWKKGKTPYVSYGAYAVVQGLLFGSLVIVGVDSLIIGSALGITAIAFLMCFGVGYLSKGRLGWAKLIVATLSLGLLFNFLVFGIFYLLIPGLFDFMYPVISLIVLVVATLYIAIDANRLKHHIDDGYALTNGVAISYAFSLYTDYMILFWKIVRILVIVTGGRSRK